ncbi:Response regulator receiver [uncultured delta proteobacterium]|uniref:Response regulator receiver n=1 Tax=uncultured delta proteobacterium TaxID=34034 RepID=A0A212K7Z0_9DELT|nr:Response regulator receiver [uncultured delta proteobacterium]
MSDSAKKILVIDDDERLHERVQDFLHANGYTYIKLTGGADVLHTLETYRPDIVLLDVMMPGEDGFSVLLKIRGASKVPVIMLTARGEDTDRIIGLELGADDYLAKPFNPRELLARIRAVLRRAEPQENGAAREPAPEHEDAESASAVNVAFSAGEVRVGSYVLDTRRQTLSRGKNTTSLSTAELCLLHAFMTRVETVLGREQLMLLAFGSDEHSTARSIDVHISRLRALLRDLGEPSTRIRTVWGSGYCWIGE